MIALLFDGKKLKEMYTGWTRWYTEGSGEDEWFAFFAECKRNGALLAVEKVAKKKAKKRTKVREKVRRFR
jgi:hypothetical protein